jgi:hypothetical protein
MADKDFVFYWFPDECKKFQARHPVWDEAMNTLVRAFDLAFTRVEETDDSADKNASRRSPHHSFLRRASRSGFLDLFHSSVRTAMIFPWATCPSVVEVSLHPHLRLSDRRVRSV